MIRVNPVAKLAAAAAIALCLIVTLDVVSAATALVLELVLLPTLGMRPGRLLRRLAPIGVGAVLSGATIALYGRTGGTVYAELLFARISDTSLGLAAATALRVLAIGIPAVALALSIDGTELADALAQTLRLPAAFVLGALAGSRLIAIAVEDRRAVALARRARGLGDHGRLRRAIAGAFAVLVLALRRGSTLATAMEARGFGAPGPRTWWRPARFGAAEVAVVAVGVGVGAVAIAAAVLTGSWAPIVS